MNNHPAPTRDGKTESIAQQGDELSLCSPGPYQFWKLAVCIALGAILIAVEHKGGSAVIAASGYLAIGLLLGDPRKRGSSRQELGFSTAVVFGAMIFWGSMFCALLCVHLFVTLKIFSGATSGGHRLDDTPRSDLHTGSAGLVSTHADLRSNFLNETKS
jgi:hypothetical protein